MEYSSLSRDLIKACNSMSVKACKPAKPNSFINANMRFTQFCMLTCNHIQLLSFSCGNVSEDMMTPFSEIPIQMSKGKFSHMNRIIENSYSTYLLISKLYLNCYWFGIHK